MYLLVDTWYFLYQVLTYLFLSVCNLHYTPLCCLPQLAAHFKVYFLGDHFLLLYQKCTWWALIRVPAMWCFFPFARQCSCRTFAVRLFESWWDSWRVPWRKKQRRSVERGGKATPLPSRRHSLSLYPLWSEDWSYCSSTSISPPSLAGLRAVRSSCTTFRP